MLCRLRSSTFRFVIPALLLLAFGCHSFAQTPAADPQTSAPANAQTPVLPPPAAGPAENAPAAAQDEQRPKEEVATHDSPATFQVRVNLVQVRVVVRDQDGKIVPNLHREDFQIFDSRKPQVISTFNVDTAEPKALPVAEPGATPEKAAEVARAAVLAKLPQRFVALVFDDVHLSIDDAVFVRSTATDFLQSLAPDDRVAIYSSSGQIKLEFTDDRELLKQTLKSIIPHSVNAGGGFHPCPEISYYEADQIVNMSNTQALAVAAEDTVQCEFQGDESKLPIALQFASTAAQQALSLGDNESTYTYTHLYDVVRRLSAMPGQRVLVFLSPGFIPSTLWTEMTDLIDRANHAKITINTIDARGLYTPDLNGDIADPGRLNPKTAGIIASYRVQAQFAQEEVLADMASGTGGTFFHNRNDIGEGLKRAAAAPEVSYLLGFSPQNLKIDGKFHELKVTLTDKRKVSIQARRGYYAPRTIKDPEAAAKADIEEAIFSQDEIHDLPLDLQTQFFKIDANAAKIAVLSHFDLRGVHFRKVGDRNDDNLTIATAIFDQNGNFVIGGEKILQMKLLANTYERLSHSGLTVKSSFNVKPGTYMVRQVVRDAEGAEMAARNGAVVIPY
jgi:VWFA-related protein